MAQSTSGRGVENASGEHSSELESIKSSFSQLRDDVAELFSHAFGLGKDGAEAARSSATDALESVKNRLGDLRDRGSESLGSVGKKIEENPLPSALVAFGVGFVIAKLLTRR